MLVHVQIRICGYCLPNNYTNKVLDHDYICICCFTHLYTCTLCSIYTFILNIRNRDHKMHKNNISKVYFIQTFGELCLHM